MGQNKEQLNKLLAFIDELAKDKDNAWFVEELYRKYGRSCDDRIEEIYEYCIEKIIFEQATQFYKDFPLKELLNELITDYRRMERYRRQNNFGDFCLAVFQQVENITNWFCHREKFIHYYKSKRDSNCIFKDKDGEDITICHLIVMSKYEDRKDLALKELYFNERLRAILYFVFFEEKTTKFAFDTKYSDFNKLYQCRNLNHRGGERNKYQEDIISEILPHQHLYYLKFTGLLVEFVEQISNFMALQEIEGKVSTVLPSAVIIDLENGERIVLDKARLLYKVKECKENDRICVERHRMNREILGIKRI